MSSNFGSNMFPIAAAVVIIVIAIGIAAAVQGTTDRPMSQIVTVGPVWPTDAWKCTSDSDFVVHAAIRGLGPDPVPMIEIFVAGLWVGTDGSAIKIWTITGHETEQLFQGHPGWIGRCMAERRTCSGSTPSRSAFCLLCVTPR